MHKHEYSLLKRLIQYDCLKQNIRTTPLKKSCIRMKCKFQIVYSPNIYIHTHYLQFMRKIYVNHKQSLSENLFSKICTCKSRMYLKFAKFWRLSTVP